MKKTLEETCINALRQIKEKQYTNELKEHCCNNHKIYVYGFAFKGKEVLIWGGCEEKIDWTKVMNKQLNSSIHKLNEILA